jgi:hypothetical protein
VRALQAAVEAGDGEIPASCPHECIEVQLSAIDAFGVPVHARLLAPGAFRRDPPSRVSCLADGLDGHTERNTERNQNMRALVKWCKVEINRFGDFDEKQDRVLLRL